MTTTKVPFEISGKTREFLVFASDQRFLAHLQDHFLSKCEPWHRVLHWNQKKIENLCQ